MNPEIFALAVTAAVFAGGAVGLILQRSLHEKYTSGGPRDMIGAVVGLLTLLSALVLGLLIWTAYGGPQLPLFGTVSRIFRAHRTGARLGT
jgi:hypothetical protein